MLFWGLASCATPQGGLAIDKTAAQLSEARHPEAARARVALGRMLFYSGDLSADGSMSCATCHIQRHAFGDDHRTRPGVHGDAGRRNVPSLVNVGARRNLTWANPTITGLEAQAHIPIFDTKPVEMGMDERGDELVERLKRDPCLSRLFARAFPQSAGRIDVNMVTSALAAFQRRIQEAPHAAPRPSRAALRGACGKPF